MINIPIYELVLFSLLLRFLLRLRVPDENTFNLVHIGVALIPSGSSVLFTSEASRGVLFASPRNEKFLVNVAAKRVLAK